MMDIKDYFYNKNRDDIYHPFSDYNEDKYFPEESLTKQLVLIRLIWDDILCLNEIYGQQKDSHKRRIILKYIVTDMCSLYDNFQGFKNLIIKDTSIKCERQKEIMRKFNGFLIKLKFFSRGNSLSVGKYRNVRNKLSAHRDRDVSLNETKNMWDIPNYKSIESTLREIEYFYNNYLKNLRIYQWAKFNKNKTVRISIPLVLKQTKN